MHVFGIHVCYRLTELLLSNNYCSRHGLLTSLSKLCALLCQALPLQTMLTTAISMCELHYWCGMTVPSSNVTAYICHFKIISICFCHHFAVCPIYHMRKAEFNGLLPLKMVGHNIKCKPYI